MTDHILLVDDNPDDQEMAMYALRRCGVTLPIVIAVDGAEALQRLSFADGDGEPAPELPALVMLDLRLPAVSGLEVLQRIRADQRTSSLPVVVLTGDDQIEDPNLHADAFLRKPVTADHFGKVMRALGLSLQEPADRTRPAGQTLGRR